MGSDGPTNSRNRRQAKEKQKAALAQEKRNHRLGQRISMETPAPRLSKETGGLPPEEAARRVVEGIPFGTPRKNMRPRRERE